MNCACRAMPHSYPASFSFFIDQRKVPMSITTNIRSNGLLSIPTHPHVYLHRVPLPRAQARARACTRTHAEPDTERGRCARGRR
jgi:hypothetical protein